jgi:hypothetical protein
MNTEETPTNRATEAEAIFTTIKDLKCPKCGNPLTFNQIRLDIFPYFHADLKLDCKDCKLSFLFGIPADRLAGMLFYTFSATVQEAAQSGTYIHRPVCPLHQQIMKPTKYWGKHLTEREYGIMQFKCPTCFLTQNVKCIDKSLTK